MIFYSLRLWWNFCRPNSVTWDENMGVSRCLGLWNIFTTHYCNLEGMDGYVGLGGIDGTLRYGTHVSRKNSIK